jgi:hypothetical protein
MTWGGSPILTSKRDLPHGEISLSGEALLEAGVLPLVRLGI